jgi:hypothetical protein
LFLCPVGDLLDTVHRVLDVTRDLVQPAPTVPELRVNRLDVTRDFRVLSPGMWIRGLQGLRPHARYSVYSDPYRGDAQTLAIGNKTGGRANLYDKSQGLRARGYELPESFLRYEVQARGWLKAADIRLLGDVTEEAATELARSWWERYDLGATVSGPTSARRISDSDLSPHDKVVLRGLHSTMQDGDEPGLSRPTVRRYSRLAAELGITLGAPDGIVSGRLDWATG